MNVFTSPLGELEAYTIIRDRLAGASPAGQGGASGAEPGRLPVGGAGGEADGRGERLSPAGGPAAAGGGQAAPGILADGCTDAQKAQLVYALSREEALQGHARYRLLVTYSEMRAREFARDCAFYDKNVAIFPARDLIFYQADLRGGEIDRERIRCLKRIVEGKPVTVVTTFSALLTPQIPARALRAAVVGIGRRDRLDLADMADRLAAMGYEKNFQVERAGQFAIRGDILDIFDLTQDNPIRIELWGDEVETIRSFDVLSQRSIDQLEYVQVFPAAELILGGRRLHDGLRRMEKEAEEAAAAFRDRGDLAAAARLQGETTRICEEARELGAFAGLESFIHYFYPMTEGLLDLFPRDQTLVFIDEPLRALRQAQAVEAEFLESMRSRAEKGYVLAGQMALLHPLPQAMAQIGRYPRVGLAVLSGAQEGVNRAEPDSGTLYFDICAQLHARDASLSGLSYEALREEMGRRRAKKERVIIVSPSRTRARRLAEELTADGVTAFYRENPMKALRPGDIMAFAGNMRRGFSYPGIGFTVLTEGEIFGEDKGQRENKRKKRHGGGEEIRNFAELKVGDFVVHEHYGIGIYRGVEKVEVEHIARDYLKIEYGEGGVLFVLPNDLSVLQKYAAAEGAKKPRLNRLGTAEWGRTRARVQKAVDEVADDLVELYARRQAKKGHVYGEDTVWQREMEELFPFEETEDQLAAIEDVKRDMEAGKIMDRLICGDVGYGKTEIAVRAAFKAVQEGMQVAVLVPTTILAQQHFNTFSERMHNFPVNVAVLSRFRTAGEIKKTLQDLERGAVDVVVGTHRLLSKDVRFKNLGLLVIDEEQRFGVAHKEKIKKLKEDVDVITLSATPIPRTLHMSMVGIRDMSVLTQPPRDRLPIQTYVMEYNEELVREAITRELARRGQVYYVHNRVNDIGLAATQVQALVPQARVAYAHGRMKEVELEQLMYDFISGRIDVLVSTTIIETGLDISNVNTIIISDADKMGLSQLYQLRGRVGRTNRTAFAFLMYKRGRILREIAEKRLAAIREFTDLGSGYRIAMRDLEIRGAGSILGRSQHGHMQAVGYDLYCKLLEGAVRRARGEDAPEERPVTVNLLADAFLPETYIANEEQKLEIYKRIGAIETAADMRDLREELSDRFGDIPLPAQNLLRIALIRAVARQLDVAELTGSGGTLRVLLDVRGRRLQVARIPVLLKAYKGRLEFAAKNAQGVPAFTLAYPLVGSAVRDEETLLSQAEGLLMQMAKHLVAR